MQRDMNFCISWKQQVGDCYGGKKERSRFSIKFNENDPMHEMVITILEQQRPHQKAQFIANAVLHYMNCSETPDIYPAPTMSRTEIEKIVMEIMQQQGKEQPKTDVKRDKPVVVKTERSSSVIYQEPVNKEATKKEATKGMDEMTKALIADTMLAFRNS